MQLNIIKLLIIIGWLLPSMAMAGTCHGRFLNPITDICWSCIFPLTIGSVKLPGFDTKKAPDMLKSDRVSSPVCYCQTPFPRVGVTVSFWEPVRLVDVTRIPFCFTSLGLSLNPGLKVSSGGTDAAVSGENVSFYHVHWYIYPLIAWLNLLIDAVCLDSQGFDVAYITEVDPLWKNDILAAILTPETALFANVVAQTACIGDCAAATAGLPLDWLFWCAGCQGSVYPLSGHVQAHVSGVQASLLLTERMIFKMHRQGLLWGTIGNQGLCNSYPMPIWRKSQYRSQMTYPIPGTAKEKFPCNPMGRSSTLYESGREFPIKGEDFAWLIFRKRECCAL